MDHNIVQLIEDVRDIIDYVESPRHNLEMYVRSLNYAMNRFIENRYDPIKTKQGYSVQKAQRIRDELRPIVVSDKGASIVSSEFINYPTNYRHLLLLEVQIDSQWYWCEPTDYDELAVIDNDPFDEPDKKFPKWIEEDDRLRIRWGDYGTLQSANIWFLREPDEMSVGFPRNHIETGDSTVNAKDYYVLDTAVFKGITYYPGEIFSADGSNLDSGKAVNEDYVVNCPLPPHAREEIVWDAAKFLEGKVDDYPQVQRTEQEQREY